MKNLFNILKIIIVFIVASLPLFSAEGEINSGDTAWMLIATGLVMMMTPAGLALFYGGLTRTKNALNTVGMSYVAFCIASVIWVLWGYTIAFGDTWGFIGSFKYFFLSNIGINEVHGTIPTLIFMAFQGMFAAIAVAIVSGSIVERMKYYSWMIFVGLWVTIVYSPMAHWVWGGGFLHKMGSLDFAGGTVIHISAGVSGLVLAILLGKRKEHELTTPSSIKLTVLGSALLWFGWFGFNGGSQLAADGLAAWAIVVTNTAASVGALGWIIVEYIYTKRITMLGTASGAIAGLVGITPAAGFVDLSGALIIGIVSGMVGYFGVFHLKHKLKYDDTLDAFGIHALAGLWGAIATGIFANPNINSAGVGALYGNPKLILIQIFASLIAIFYAAAGTYVCYKIVGLFTKGVRVHEKYETEGLDSSFHGESSFDAAKS